MPLTPAAIGDGIARVYGLRNVQGEHLLPFHRPLLRPVFFKLISSSFFPSLSLQPVSRWSMCSDRSGEHALTTYYASRYAEEMVEFSSGVRGMCLNLEADNVFVSLSCLLLRVWSFI